MKSDQTRENRTIGRLGSFVLVSFMCLTAVAAAMVLLGRQSAPAETEKPRQMSLLRYASPAEEEAEAAPGPEPAVELVDIDEDLVKGKLILVRDPGLVTLDCVEPLGMAPGKTVVDFAAGQGAVAAVNAGGYEDNGGRSDGTYPVGLVIRDGVIRWGGPYDLYHVAGLTEDGRLLVGEMTGQQALDAGIRSGVSFVTYDGRSCELIIDGQIQEQNLGPGVNPRTAIGQREDGTLLLLLLDGRGFETLGATLEDVCRVMRDYGAVTAANLDGGASSSMAWQGELVNRSTSVMGARTVPTAFVVGGEG